MAHAESHVLPFRVLPPPGVFPSSPPFSIRAEEAVTVIFITKGENIEITLFFQETFLYDICSVYMLCMIYYLKRKKGCTFISRYFANQILFLVPVSLRSP